MQHRGRRQAVRWTLPSSQQHPFPVICRYRPVLCGAATSSHDRLDHCGILPSPFCSCSSRYPSSFLGIPLDKRNASAKVTDQQERRDDSSVSCRHHDQKSAACMFHASRHYEHQPQGRRPYQAACDQNLISSRRRLLVSLDGETRWEIQCAEHARFWLSVRSIAAWCLVGLRVLRLALTGASRRRHRTLHCGGE